MDATRMSKKETLYICFWNGALRQAVWLPPQVLASGARPGVRGCPRIAGGFGQNTFRRMLADSAADFGGRGRRI
eukprot:2015525-Lingulodinium_polyedra.AAC.1